MLSKMMETLYNAVVNDGDNNGNDTTLEKKLGNISCKSCGNKYFSKCTEVKVVPALLSPTGHEQITFIDVLVCIKCNRRLEFTEQEKQALRETLNSLMTQTLSQRVGNISNIGGVRKMTRIK